MIWQKKENTKLEIKSWCENIEESAMDQAINLANHPEMFKHIAIMPDCHTGYGMPIGGVIACENSIIPNAVGVDIGCGMGAIKTNLKRDLFTDKYKIREILNGIKERVPVGEGNSHETDQQWDGFEKYISSLETNLDPANLRFDSGELPWWLSKRVWKLSQKNLGTLGGGNHFIEIQYDEDDYIWLMLHSGSRNLGYKVAEFYNAIAKRIVDENNISIPDDDLAFLSVDSVDGKSYIRDMNFALSYAEENRRLMMSVVKDIFKQNFPEVTFDQEINIHHNYVSLENHYDKDVWVHRKGATSAKVDELGIIPGSMGTPSYIVQGLGNPESFKSCSHGAGRVMSRMKACKELSINECNDAMGDVVFDRWKKLEFKMGRRRKKKSDLYDFGESPLAYKDIHSVIKSELDLIKPVTLLKPLGVIKG